MVAAPRRYRLKLATWTVVREPGQPSPRTLSSPLAVVELAKDLVLDADDDKERFWVVLLNAQNHYLLHTEVSVGTQSASLVHPREVLGPALREGAASIILLHNHPSGVMRSVELCRLDAPRSEEHTSELQSHHDLVCRLLLEKKKKKNKKNNI